jgi:asparagine synthase (glutamine-hydrolysing)
VTAFACRLDVTGAPLPLDSAAALASRIGGSGGTVRVEAAGPFAAVAGLHPHRPLLARLGATVAAGDVRLDNRDEVAGWGGVPAAGSTDLELVLAAYGARDPAVLDGLLGDFGLVLWDSARGELTAVRDAFGVKPLFVAHDGATLLLSSSLDALAGERDVDEEFVADFLAGGSSPGGRTIWAGCRALEPGEVLRSADGIVTTRRAWSPFAFTPAARVDERQATETFRELFLESVRLRADGGGGGVWAHLSGGLDSSSVVCAADHLARAGRLPRGLDGTVTMVDTLGDGDERRWSDAVVERCGVANETLVDRWAWQDDAAPPTRTGEPRSHYPFWARDRAMTALLRERGARVLLSGQGADHYLTGNWGYVTDLLAARRVGEGLRELTRLSVGVRQSFWTGLGRHGVQPFLPAALRQRTARRHERLPGWIEPAFARRTGMEDRLPAARRLAVEERRGSRFAHEIAVEMAGLTGFLEREPFGGALEVRYPFLYRPLVEHSLRLPPQMRIRAGTGKYVLREAMRGILPEAVRTRRGKGGIDARLLWTLGHEAPRLRELLRDPVVARRGWVRPDRLRQAVEDARCGEVGSLPFLLCTLALETWLAAREGASPWDRQMNDTAA